MSTFVLIHGGWAGGWVWEKLTPFLEADGHTVVAPDLPGHGSDRTPLNEITLDSYVHRVVQVLDAQPERATLVGHSSGGAIITQAAQRRPDKIGLLVYLAAHLPRDGQSVLDLGKIDLRSLLMPNLVFSDDRTSAVVRQEVLRAALFADCADEDYQRAIPRRVPEPLAPVATPVSTSEHNFGRVPRAYVRCLRDRALSPDLQRHMYTAVPCSAVISMETGHMPQYAAPRALAAHLTELSANMGVERAERTSRVGLLDLTAGDELTAHRFASPRG